MNTKNFILTDFALGLIVGFVAAGIIFGIISGLIYANNKKKEVLKNALLQIEKHIEIMELHEDYSTRTVDELLEIPDVRGAADTASGEFIRKRDEILQRFRSRITD